MVTVSVKGVLIGILLVALIVLVVFLIVMVSRLTDTIKKANAIIDSGTGAVTGTKEKINGVFESAKSKVGMGVGLVQGLFNKIL